jgi:hypothetical protein
MYQILNFPLVISIAVYNERLAMVLGILTLLSGLAVFLSCRTCIKILNKTGFKKMIAGKTFQRLLKYHTYYWWTFWLIFVLHLMSAIMHLGFNTAGDSNAYLHKYSLIFGLSALAAVIAVRFSCHGIGVVVRLFSERKPTEFKLIGLVYKYHSYYWVVFFILIAAHYTAGFLHSGWWPTGI